MGSSTTPHPTHSQAQKEAVLANLRSTERHLLRDPQRATAYCTEIEKLEKAGYAVKVPEEEVREATESWFICSYAECSSVHRTVLLRG